MSLFCHFLAEKRESVTFFVWTALTLTLLPTLVHSDSIPLEIGQASFRAELAITAEQRKKGLMFRSRLGLNKGMLLVYPKTGDHRIWMKNMQIPLTVAWINNHFQIVDVKKLMPCQKSPCPVYSASGSSRYVLELNYSIDNLSIGEQVRGLEGIEFQEPASSPRNN